MAIEQLEAATSAGTTVPLVGGHLVIVGAGDINAEVVCFAVARAADDHAACVLFVAVPGEIPSGGDGGGGGQDGEDGGELHFEWDFGLEKECKYCTSL